MSELLKLYESYDEDELSSDAWGRSPELEDYTNLRRREYAPHLKSLDGRKVIYKERVAGFAAFFDAKLTKRGFEAELVPLNLISTLPHNFHPGVWKRPWKISSPWNCLCLYRRSFRVRYVGWSLWPEPDFVEEIETLLEQGKRGDAISMINRN